MTQDRAFRERGLASWYGRKFHGRRTASGETYDMYAMTAAHATLPIPSYARVRNPANGREVIVRINDRGPFHPGRIVDLSYTAALKLDLLRGVAPVELERITFAEIRSGAWRRGEPAPRPPPPPVLDVAPVAGCPRRAGRGAARWSSRARLLDPARRLPPARRRRASSVAWPTSSTGSRRAGGIRRHALVPPAGGAYASREEARGGAERVRDALQLVPLIVERRWKCS